jgi:hypothetical protein
MRKKGSPRPNPFHFCEQRGVNGKDSSQGILSDCTGYVQRFLNQSYDKTCLLASVEQSEVDQAKTLANFTIATFHRKVQWLKVEAVKILATRKMSEEDPRKDP